MGRVIRKIFCLSIPQKCTRIDMARGSSALGLFIAATIAKLHINGDKRGSIKAENNSG